MSHRAYCLSSSWELVIRERDYLKGMFFKLGYPDRLVNATVTSFLNSVFVEKDQVQKNNAMSEGNIIRVIQRSEICRLRPKTAQRSWQQHRQSNTNGIHEFNFKFRRENHPSLAGNVLYINLNVICTIQIISATLLVISISELTNIEPLPWMWKVATEFQTLSFWSNYLF